LTSRVPERAATATIMPTTPVLLWVADIAARFAGGYYRRVPLIVTSCKLLMYAVQGSSALGSEACWMRLAT